MIKIDRVDYTLCTLGPARGHPIIDIFFEQTADDEDYDIFKDFKKRIEDKNYDKFYERAINGQLETYFEFNEGFILDSKNIKYFEALYDGISSESIELQKEMRKNNKITLGGIRPPFMMWKGIPDTFTGGANSYEYFNVPYVVIDNTTEYSQIALQQIVNHTYAKILVKWIGNGKDEDFINEIRDTYSAAYYKIMIISEPNKRKEAEEFCLDKGFCYYPIV
jgi:hypothetical protein